MRTYYCGIDLHARFSALGLIDDQGHKVDEAKLDNDLPSILNFLAPYGPDLHVAIESTINWYWLVDGLQEQGYDVHLGHTLGLYMITGAKIKTDRRDAFKLARYLRLGEFPEAYIYPKEKRALRDFLPSAWSRPGRVAIEVCASSWCATTWAPWIPIGSNKSTGRR